MHGLMRRAIFVLMATLICGVVTPGTASADPTRGIEREVAVVRVIIQQIDGEVLRATKATPWGERMEFDLGDHELDLSITDRHHLDVHYASDGSKIVERSVEAPPRESVVVHTDDNVKITVRIVPVKVRVHGATLD